MKHAMDKEDRYTSPMMDFEEAVTLAREIMARAGWHVMAVHHDGYRHRWWVAARQVRGNTSMYSLKTYEEWERTRDRLEAARHE